VLVAQSGLGSAGLQKEGVFRMAKSLRSLGGERKSRKNVHLDRDHETNWEIST
jgi:hypothetical protein